MATYTGTSLYGSATMQGFTSRLNALCALARAGTLRHALHTVCRAGSAGGVMSMEAIRLYDNGGKTVDRYTAGAYSRLLRSLGHECGAVPPTRVRATCHGDARAALGQAQLPTICPESL
jgi:hypothetical protein